MSREILFRGKRVDNGEWGEGNYLLWSSRPGIQDYAVTNGEVFNVIPETVGQYTGLRDKNGVRIFEGDIISYNGSKESVYYDTSLRIPCFTTGIGHGSSSAPHPYKISKRHVVIGNIHDPIPDDDKAHSGLLERE